MADGTHAHTDGTGTYIRMTVAQHLRTIQSQYPEPSCVFSGKTCRGKCLQLPSPGGGAWVQAANFAHHT